MNEITPWVVYAFFAGLGIAAAIAAIVASVKYDKLYDFLHQFVGAFLDWRELAALQAHFTFRTSDDAKTLVITIDNEPCDDTAAQGGEEGQG